MQTIDCFGREFVLTRQMFDTLNGIDQRKKVKEVKDKDEVKKTGVLSNQNRSWKNWTCTQFPISFFLFLLLLYYTHLFRRQKVWKKLIQLNRNVCSYHNRPDVNDFTFFELFLFRFLITKFSHVVWKVIHRHTLFWKCFESANFHVSIDLSRFSDLFLCF